MTQVIHVPTDQFAARSRLSYGKLLGATVIFAASMEFTVPGTFGTTASEVALYGGALAVIISGRIQVRIEHLILSACILLGIFTMIFWGYDRAYGPYIKTLLNLICGLIIWDRILRSDRNGELSLGFLSSIGTIVAIYSIAQSILGFGILPDVYSLGGVPASSQDQAIDLVAGHGAKLQNVMVWKADLINRAAGFKMLNGLGYGLHAFSANMAEYLVYVSVAAWMVLYRRPRKIYALMALQVLILISILLSGSRTALLGYFMVNAGMLTIMAGPYRLILLFAATLTGTAALTVIDWSVFLFDDGGTLEGRADLNNYAISYIAKDAFSLLFGGNAADYARTAYSNVHNTSLYYLLYGGIFVALSVTGLLIRWLVNAATQTALSTDDEGYLTSGGCLLAIFWFFAYGLQWAVVTFPNSVILVTLFVAIMSAERRNRRALRSHLNDPRSPIGF